MKFKYTILYVQNVPKTAEFYQRAFGFTLGFIHDGQDYAELSTGQTTLAFSSQSLMTQLGKAPSQPDINAPNFELAFECDDVEAAKTTALNAGAALVSDVEQTPWGQTLCYVSDPNGFLIELCTKVEK